MWFEQFLFFVTAIGALGGALGVVMLRNPFYSVLSLVAHLLSLAVLFLLLRAEFLAAAQVVVYAGAVMVLYVFVVAYIGGSDEPLRRRAAPLATFGPLFAARSRSSSASRCSAPASRPWTRAARTSEPDFGTPAEIGSLLLRRFLVPFEAASFLLLMAAVGAVVLARRRRGLEEPPDDLPTEVVA